MRVERLQCLRLLHSDRSPVILHPLRLWPEVPIEWPRRHFLQMHLRCRFPLSRRRRGVDSTEIDQLGDPMHLRRHRIQRSRKHHHPLQPNHQSLPQLTPIRRMHPVVTLELPCHLQRSTLCRPCRCRFGLQKQIPSHSPHQHQPPRPQTHRHPMQSLRRTPARSLHLRPRCCHRRSTRPHQMSSGKISRSRPRCGLMAQKMRSPIASAHRRKHQSLPLRMQHFESPHCHSMMLLLRSILPPCLRRRQSQIPPESKLCSHFRQHFHLPPRISIRPCLELHLWPWYSGRRSDRQPGLLSAKPIDRSDRHLQSWLP